MITVILVIHLLLAIGLVGVILLQQSEGGALGIGGGGGMGGFLTGRGTANLLTRTTTVLAVLFFLTSLTLARLAGEHRGGGSLFEGTTPVPVEQSAPAPQPEPEPQPQPEQPAEPAAPIAH